MKKYFGFLAPILLALVIIVACKKEEVKECPPPANTFSLEYKDSLLIFTYSENSQGLTEIDLGEVGFLPGTGIRRSGKSTAVYNNIPRGEEYHYYVRTDCGDGNYSYWVGPIKINTSCYGEATDYYTTTKDSSVTITWNNAPKLVEIEYGLEGFARGTGNFTNSDLESLTINKLSNGRRYSFYGRSVCDDDSYGFWMGPYSFEITGSSNIGCDGTFKEYTEGIELFTQTDVDNFGANCYTKVNSLQINSSSEFRDPITDLTPLSTITEVTTELRVINTKVTSLLGLENITSIVSPGFSYIGIDSNPMLTDVSGIGNIATKVEHVVFTNNPLIEDFCPLSNLVNNYVIINFEVNGSKYNPTKQDMADGNCKL